MTIGICDDLKAAVLELQEIIEEYCRKKEITADIVTFDRGEEALLHIDSVDILFLDMEMPGMDGIETGKEILKRRTVKSLWRPAMKNGLKRRFT